MDTDTRHLTTEIPSENCVVRRFRRCANVIECTYTNLDTIAYYTLKLYDIVYYSNATNLYSMLLYWITVVKCNTLVSITILRYNIMGPHSYLRSVVNQNVVMRRIPVYENL